MKSLLGFAAAALAVAATISACARIDGGSGSANSLADESTQGRRAVEFTARDIDGKTVRLSDYLGKQAVLLDFCATWCQPCLAEMGHLRRLYDKNKERGFVILAIAMDSSDTISEVPAWAHRNNLKFPVLLDEDSHIAGIYNPKKSAPLTVLINKSSEIVYVHDGYNTGDEIALGQHVESVLATAPPAPASASASPPPK